MDHLKQRISDGAISIISDKLLIHLIGQGLEYKMTVYSNGWPYNELHKTLKIPLSFHASQHCHKVDNLENNIILQPHCTSAIISCSTMKSTSILIE